jgi:hypothetical protein
MLLRRAITDWVDQQRDPPDYSETLSKIAVDLTQTRKWVVWMAERPALALTADELAQRIKAAGGDARTADRRLITEAVDGLQRANHDLSGWTVQARTTELQERRLLQVGAVAGGLSLVLGLVLPLAVVQAAPEGWHWPERAAAFVLHTDRWDAGERLLASVDPARWRGMLSSSALANQYRSATGHGPLVDQPLKGEKRKVGPASHFRSGLD